MWPTLRKLWLTLSRKAPLACSPHRRSRGRRPFLEALEDRTVPASPGLGYFSTSLNATVWATAADSAGDLYVTGSAGSGFTPTPGAFQTSGGPEFVAKLNPTGGLIYATYLGSGGDINFGSGQGTAIAVDAAGDAYVFSEGGTVPTTANAIASSPTSPWNDFVAELNPTGSGLNYATYLPGTDYGLNNGLSYAGGIAVDGSGNIYVAGATGGGLPVTAGAYQTTNPGSDLEPFFMKINPALSGAASVVYSSYLGGSSGDWATGIAVDGAGNAYVEGVADSSNFPTTSGAFMTGKPSGGGYAFVAKLDPALSGAASLVYSTYLGGTGGASGFVSNHPDVIVQGEIAGGIAVDSAGNAYVTSATTSPNFPTTPGAYQTTSNIQHSGFFPACDVFVTKLNATGSALVYSTYLGGGTIQGFGTNSGGAGIAVDASGDAYVTGWTDSTSFPTKNPVQATNSAASGYDGGGDGMNAFVTELNPAGSGLLFSTYLGTSSNNTDFDGYGIALDPAGNVYVGGATASAGSGNWYATGSGFVAKINLAPSPSFAVAGFPSSTTAGVAHTFTVTSLNADGTVNTGYTGTVHISSSDPHAILPADYPFTAADQGVHTFSVTLKTAGSQSITAIDTTGSFDGSESGIVVQPAAASQFILAAPSSVTSGAKFSVTLTVEDAYGNVVSGYRGTVHFSSSDGTASLPGNYTFTAADAGVHTFAKVILRKRGTQTLTVTDTHNSALTATDSISVV